MEVTGTAPLVDSSTSDLGTVVDQKQVRDLPVTVNGNMRNPEAFVFLAPGVTAGEVELATLRLAQELGVADNLRHHVGHSIGLEGHEAPFLDRGDEAVLEAGMVFTVEPGVYVKGLGGFRHSDTVVITDQGCRVMTDYPRDLEELVITS